MTNCTEQNEIMNELQKPFDVKDIKWRVQRVVAIGNTNSYKAVVCAYVTNRAIQARLDEVVGPFNWKNDYQEWREEGVMCQISIKIGEEWITKSDGADVTQYESTKGGFSVSMKRAAVQWGIGRYLSEVPEQWVDIKKSGKNYCCSEVKVGKDNKIWVKGYWDTPKIFDNKSSNNNQSDNKQQEKNKLNQQSNKQSNPLASVIREVKHLENCLELNNDTIIHVFNTVNPGTRIFKVDDMFKSDEKCVVQYLNAIKPAALIRKMIKDAGIQDEDSVLTWLGDKSNKTFNSFVSLIGLANQKTVDAVRLQLGVNEQKTAS